MIPHFAFSDFPGVIKRLPRLPLAARNGVPTGRRPAKVRRAVVATVESGDYLPAHTGLMRSDCGALRVTPLGRI